MSHERVLITAPKSGSGKTLITCGLIETLKKRQLKIAAMKCGPDYVDPMFHRCVLGVPSGNLDTFFTDERVTRHLLGKKMEQADVTVLEGVMGYYDGIGGCSTLGSTFAVAKVTETPVILVVDAKGASVTLAALIQGIVEFRARNNIRGVILNRVSEGYYKRIKTVIETETTVRVLGFLPDVKALHVPSRHLGLIQPEDMPAFRDWINCVADATEKYIDVEAVLELAQGAKSLQYDENILDVEEPIGIRIAVARDEAFSFYYQENLDLLKRLGAELVFFSPIHDRELPEDVQGVLFGGGYPEKYAFELSENEAMRRSIREALACGMPCLAECGGFLYLQQSLESMEGVEYEMVGTLSGRGFRTPKLCRFGYIEAERNQETGDGDCSLRGHEFHYWDCTENGDAYTAWKPAVAVGDEGEYICGKEEAKTVYSCMVRRGNILAGFPHFYYYSDPGFAREFVERCKAYGKR